MLVIAIAAALGLGACAKPTTMVQQQRPAASSEAAAIRSIAVAPFSGRKGRMVARWLAAELDDAQVDGRPYFQLKRPASGTRPPVDLHSAIALGRRLDVAGVYTGDVVGLGAETRRYSEERTKCVSRNDDGDCLRWRDYRVTCRQRTASAVIAPRLVDVGSGQVVYSRKHESHVQRKGCEDEGPLPGEDELAAAALRQVIRDVREDVAPYVETLRVPVRPAPEDLEDQAAERFEVAYDFMKEGDADRACRRWEDLELEGHADPNLSYNLAICDERVGNIRSALSRVREAIATLDDVDEDFLKAEDRYEQLLNERQTLSQQLTGPGSGRMSDKGGMAPIAQLSAGEIQELQTLLTRLGYRPGPIDGYMGPKTAAAIRRFEAATGLPERGAATPAILQALRQQFGS